MPNSVDTMAVVECRELLDGHHFGRICFMDHVGVLPSIVPVNYLLDEDHIVIRTDAGSKLAAAVRGAPVAFEVDGHGAARLRELRHARRLRRARASRHLRQGRDRHRALRRIVARHQAQGRRRARRHRLPHLSDPRDDGYSGGDVFPKGQCARAMACSAAPSMDMPLYPGDPLTPGVGATKDAKRLAIKDAQTITKIPVLPISYGDAQPLLDAMGGPVAPEDWRGALPITYRLGAGPGEGAPQGQVRLGHKPLYDVIAKIPGSHVARPVGDSRQSPRRMGERRRRSDRRPASPELEEARALGELLKQGWRRAGRSSTPCGTARSRGCSARPSGRDARGRAAAAARRLHQQRHERSRLSCACERLAHAREVHQRRRAGHRGSRDEAHRVEARSQAQPIARPARADERKDARDRADLRIGALGSGSDYTPFLQHLGVAVAQFRLRRRGRRRHLPLGLRRLLLVHAFQRHDLRLWPCAGADRRHRGDAARRRRRAAVRLHESRRHRAQVHRPSCRSSPEGEEDDGREREPRARRGRLRAQRTIRGTDASRRRRSPCRRTLNFAPLQNAADSLTRARSDTPRRSARRWARATRRDASASLAA